MDSTKDIFAKYKAAEKTAATNLELIPGNTRPGFEIRVANAKRDVEFLRSEYRRRVMDSAKVLFVVGNGDQTAQFLELAHCYTVDAERCYRVLTETVEPTVGHHRQFDATQMAALYTALHMMAQESGFEGDVRKVRLNTNVPVPTKADVVNQVRRLVRAGLGDGLNGIHVAQELTNAALNGGFDGESLPVCVLNSVEEERVGLGMLFRRSAMVDVDSVETVDAKFVTEALAKVGYEVPTATVISGVSDKEVEKELHALTTELLQPASDVGTPFFGGHTTPEDAEAIEKANSEALKSPDQPKIKVKKIKQ